MTSFNLRKTIILLTLVFIIGSGFSFIQNNQVQALTIADRNGIPSSCPHKYPWNTGSCSIAIDSITVNGFLDNDTSYTARTTAVLYGYIIPGQTITISWTDNTDGWNDPYGMGINNYLVKYGCGNSINLANDDYLIKTSVGAKSVTWKVPPTVSGYQYCKIWVYAQSIIQNDQPTLGVSNTRAFSIQQETPAPTVDITATPSTITQGDSSTLTWNSNNADSCIASGGWSGSKSIDDGYQTVTPSQTTTYSISCSGPGGGATDSTTVTVHPPQQCLISNFSANPTSLDSGDSTLLSWQSTNCGQCTASANYYNYYWTGNVSTSGNNNKTIYNLTKTTIFTLNCSSNVNSDSKTVTVTVTPPVTRYACNTTTYQCYINSSGPYTSLSSCQSNCQAPPPTRYACNTTTYQCYINSSGPYTSLSSCQSNCQASTPTVTLTANPVNITQGDSSTLTWNSNNADSCIASGGWSGSKSIDDGYQTVTPSQTTTYSISCSGPGGSATDYATVIVNNQPPSFNFNLSHSGDIVVTRPTTGSIARSNSIITTLISGNTQTVSFNQTGLPSGVTASSIYSCSPTCNKINNLTINSSASLGSHPITITAQGGGITRTTVYNLVIQEGASTSLSVSCYATPNPAQINQNVTFNSNVSGGNGNYTYSWSGSASGNSSYAQRSFSSSGNYTAYLHVYDSENRSGSASCSVNVESQYLPAPDINLWADKYTLTQGESTHLRWTSTHTDYCVASNGWSGTKSTSNYEPTSPSGTTAYTLTCYGNGKQSTKSLTIYVSSSGKNLSLTKLGRNLSQGDRVYQKVIRVTESDVIQFYITVTAGQNKDLSNVILKDPLPAPLSYMAGTTKINGIIQPDTITTTGLNLGTIPRGTSKTVVFHALSGATGTYLTYTNTAEVVASGESTVQDSASIVYGLVAGAATVKTGASDSLLLTLLISLAFALFTWYYLKFNPRGQLAFANMESNIRDWKLNTIRQKIKRNN